MAIVFVITNLILLLIFYEVYKKDVANPGFLYLLIWFSVSIATVFFMETNGLILRWYTFLVFVIGNTWFAMGAYISDNQRNKLKSQTSKKLQYYSVHPALVVLTVLLLMGMFYYMYLDIKRIGILADYKRTSFFQLLESTRFMSTKGLARVTYLTANFVRLNFSVGIVYFYFLCSDLFLSEKRNILYRLTLVFVIVLTLFGTLFSTGRTELLGLISGFLFIYLLFYCKIFAWQDKKYIKVLFRRIVLSGIVFVIFFVLVGAIVLNRLGGSSVFNNVIKYIGSPIAAFDYYLHTPDQYVPNTYFGQNTFISIYSTLKSLNLHVGEINPFLPQVQFLSSKTNVYTIYYYFAQDFGTPTAMLLQLVYGFIFGKLYHIIKYKKFTPMFVILYGILAYALVITFFQEALFSILTTHIIKFLMAMVLFVILSRGTIILQKLKNKKLKI